MEAYLISRIQVGTTFLCSKRPLVLRDEIKSSLYLLWVVALISGWWVHNATWLHSTNPSYPSGLQATHARHRLRLFDDHWGVRNERWWLSCAPCCLDLARMYNKHWLYLSTGQNFVQCEWTFGSGGVWSCHAETGFSAVQWLRKKRFVYLDSFVFLLTLLHDAFVLIFDCHLNPDTAPDLVQARSDWRNQASSGSHIFKFNQFLSFRDVSSSLNFLRSFHEIKFCCYRFL